MSRLPLIGLCLLAAIGASQGTSQRAKAQENPAELATTGWGTLRGTAVRLADAKDKGLGNVVVFLQPPNGRFFPIRAEDKKRTDAVTLRQANLDFVPHVFVLYPSYYDGAVKDHKPSGQRFIVKNDDERVHSFKFLHYNIYLPPGGQRPEEGKRPFDLIASSEAPITFECSFDPPRRAFAWALDHPYAAVSDTDGKFAIPHLPIGAKLRVVGWHEDGTVIFPGGHTGSAEMVLDKETILHLKVKKK
jgi:hypothetical protein